MRPRSRPGRPGPLLHGVVLVLAVVLGTTLAAGCARVPKVSMPKVSLPSLPSFGDDEAAEDAADEAAAAPAPVPDVTATPRELLGARLANPRARPDMPGMTVGKLIEFADRYLACDCATTRFVQRWEKTADGYRATPYSDTVRPLEFKCHDGDGGRECFLAEIDRGAAGGAFANRFVPGSEFIEFLYDNGVRCERTEPCPSGDDAAAGNAAPATAGTPAAAVPAAEADAADAAATPAAPAAETGQGKDAGKVRVRTRRRKTGDEIDPEADAYNY